MLRSVLRASASGRSSIRRSSILLLSPSSRNFAAKTNKNKVAKDKKDPTRITSADVLPAADNDMDTSFADAQARMRRLEANNRDISLDVFPNGRRLFTSTRSLSLLSRKDACSYFNFSMEDLNNVLPEGLPVGMVKEFDDSLRPALLVRQSFLDLRDNFRRIVDPPLQLSDDKGPKVRKQIVLDGPVNCGKSIALAMLVHWARDEGWLVFYVPRGREWTHGGFFSKNPDTGFWDTPLQAASVLKDFLKWNESHLKQLPCQINEPIPVGEGAGDGRLKDVDSIAMPEGSMLSDLVNTGIKRSQAAVGVVVRLRRELSLVKSIPVLIAIDQYNSWFTFSEYEEAVTLHSRRQVHAREIAMVNAFRTMMHDDMMVGAFSHSTAVGKLRQHLPDVPVDARVNFPRYSLDEAESVCFYYLRQRLVRPEVYSEDNWKKVYYLSNGNGAEIRWLLPFMREQT